MCGLPNEWTILFYIYMNPSISLLTLLLFLALLVPSTPWCYKSFFAIQGEAPIMDISPDNAYMAITAISQNAILVYDLANYNLLLNYTPPSSTVASAKFTNDGIYLGIALNNGNINLISGRPTFNSSVLIPFTTGLAIADIDFNTNNNKMLVCYSNTARYDIYHNYTGVGTQSTVQKNVGNNILRCMFSANDDIGLIDNNKMIKIYTSSNTISTSITSNANFKNFDIKPTTATPIKFIASGNDTKGYYATDTNPGSMTANSFSGSSVLSGGVMTPACYSGDALYYAFGGSNSDGRVFVFYDNDTLGYVFNDAFSVSNYPFASC